MKLYLHEITDQELVVNVTEKEPWVVQAIIQADETRESRDHTPSSKEAARPAQAQFRLRKVDDVVVLSGTLNTSVELICSRCANPFSYPLDATFSSLYSTDPELAGVGHLNEDGEIKGHNHGVARHAHDKSLDASNHESDNPDDFTGEEFDLAADDNEGIEDTEEGHSTAGALDIIYLAEETLDLSEVLTEQVQFQLPFQPLCQTQCKGICFQCGTDLNIKTCNCAPITKENAFSVLKDFKLKS